MRGLLIWAPVTSKISNRYMVITEEQEATYAHDAWSLAINRIRTLQHHMQESDDRLTGFGERVRALERRDVPPDTGSIKMPQKNNGLSAAAERAQKKPSIQEKSTMVKLQSKKVKP
ncbi:hypothetical protein Tco_1391156 [Tanacetum coccineum]